MAVAGIKATAQLSLPELDSQLSKNLGKRIKLPFSTDDIGGELISVLSKGLYTNPLDCVREYVQNSVDANATAVTIKITGNSVMIRDDGDGMDLSDLLQARQFGLSLKSLIEHVGFRGIGLYSGFDLCSRLRLTTKKTGHSDIHVLVFDFAAMRAQLEKDRKEIGKPKTPLLTLLSEHTRIGRESPSFAVEHHFTTVQLEDISDVHIRQLSNRSDLRRYLLQTVPLDFDEEFEWRAEINQHLFANVRGYRAIKLLLQSDGAKDETIAKDAISNLGHPTFGFVTSGGQQIAYYWACLTKGRGKIETVGDDNANYAGFVYKIKGFTIGDRASLRDKFTRKPQLYPWYTGEIYVLDTAVTPNAERDDFETNPAKNALELNVGIELAELENAAEEAQAQGVADERVERYREEIGAFDKQIAGNTQTDDFKAYSRLDQIARDLGRQKNHVSEQHRPEAEELLRRAKSLQRQLRKEVDEPRPQAKRRRRAARDEELPVRPAVPATTGLPAVPPKTLPKVLEDAGWALEDDLGRLVEILQGSLDDVLGSGSAIYQTLLNDLEAKLSPTAPE